MQVGNALTDDFNDHFGIFQFMWAAGLISDQTYKLLNLVCDSESFIHTSEECNKVLDTASNELGDIDPYSIFTPSCPGSATFSRNKLLKRLHVSICMIRNQTMSWQVFSKLWYYLFILVCLWLYVRLDQYFYGYKSAKEKYIIRQEAKELFISKERFIFCSLESHFHCLFTWLEIIWIEFHFKFAHALFVWWD